MARCAIPAIPLSQRLAFTLGEVSALTRLSIASLYKEINAGRLPSIKVAGRRLIRREDLEAFLCARAPGARANSKDSRAERESVR